MIAIYRLLDVDVPSSIKTEILELLTEGAPLLLPPQDERIRLLQNLLPKGSGNWESLSLGQVGRYYGTSITQSWYCSIGKLYSVSLQLLSFSRSSCILY